MVSFECTFEVATRQEAVWVLQEMIDQIEGDNYCGFFSYADGSWSSSGEDEPEENED